MKRGVIAEYASEAALLAAIRSVRERGFTRLEAFSPIPSQAIDDALGARRSPLALAAGAGGLAGAIGGYALQWWLVARLYPLDIGSRPPHMPLPFAIISIEMGFLLGAISVVVAFVIAARLFGPWHPFLEVPGFESATRDGFWLAIDAGDPVWNHTTVLAVLSESQPEQVHGFGGAA